MKFNIICVSVKNRAFNVTGKKPVLFFGDSVCFLLNRFLGIDFLNNDIDFVNNFQLIKYYSELWSNYGTTLKVWPNFLLGILIFGVSGVLSVFHSILLFLPKYKKFKDSKWFKVIDTVIFVWNFC